MTAAANSLSSRSWPASVALGFTHDERYGTRMMQCTSQGPLRVQRPFFPEHQHRAHVYLLHPPGGLVSGDSLQIDVSLADRAQVVITTPGAGKVYRGLGGGLRQVQTQRFALHDDAVLEYLPQETIVFNGAHAINSTTVELNGHAVFAGWDIVCLGRPAAQETFQQGYYEQSVNIRRNGIPVLTDRLHFQGGSALLEKPWGLGGNVVFGSFITCLTSDERATERLGIYRHWLAQTNGSSELSDRVVVTAQRSTVICRYLGHCTEEAKTLFTGLWQCCGNDINTGNSAQKKDSIPRIWYT